MSRYDKDRELRLKIIDHYTSGIPRCQACGAKTPKLEVSVADSPDPVLKLKSTRGGTLYRYIVEAGFPRGVTIKCSSCRTRKWRTMTAIEFGKARHGA